MISIATRATSWTFQCTHNRTSSLVYTKQKQNQQSCEVLKNTLIQSATCQKRKQGHASLGLLPHSQTPSRRGGAHGHDAQSLGPEAFAPQSGRSHDCTLPLPHTGYHPANTTNSSPNNRTITDITQKSTNSRYARVSLNVRLAKL